MNAPQTFPVNGHRLRPVAQFLLGPLLERRLESLPVQPFEDQMQSGYRRGLAPFETQPGSQIAMLPAPLVNGLEAVAVGQHGTDRQG